MSAMVVYAIKFFIVGFLFGAIMQYADINKNSTISGMASGDDFTVGKTIALALGLGAILLNIEVAMGFASYHVIPFLVVGVVVGGLLFGAGMAILGYCPGTLPISLGQGSMDALIGVFGGLAASALYTYYAPVIEPLLGPNLGHVSLNTVMGSTPLFYILVVLFGALCIGGAFFLDKIEGKKSRKWIVSGVGLALIFSISFTHHVLDNVVGASTAFIYMGDELFGQTYETFFTKWEVAGEMQSFFIVGALVAGFIFSVAKKEFKLVLLHTNWVKYHGPSKTKRVIWAFIGGFILFIGARMAGGCTSGHVISGGIQFAFSSLTFALFLFIGLLVTGRLFYRK